MSDALPLPPRPNLEQYKKLAKDLQRASRSGDPAAIQDWARSWLETLARHRSQQITPDVRRQMAYEVEKMSQSWHKLAERRAGPCRLADAQFFVARMQGFASWPKFAKHVEALVRVRSQSAQFEAAVDAIVRGDVRTLKKLLAANPSLVRARSDREHRSTLLHYVSANGVEDFRQKTPKNVVAITKLLLDAGADVNAESKAYGGRSTTLGLTATSCHPEEAGVQLPLMDLLIAKGAKIDGPDGGSAVNGCLQNGRGEAAAFFAQRGARLDLEGAAGVGDLEAVKSFFTKTGRRKATATSEQMNNAFAWACEFGRTRVVEFLLERGVPLDAKLPHDGQIGLHWAAYGGHAETVKLLLECGSPVDAQDPSYGGTPLGWALYAWGNTPSPGSQYYDVVALLARAGAKLDEPWYADDEDRRRALQKVRSDDRMVAAMLGEMGSGGLRYPKRRTNQ